jgi:preprotein translocase subunit SecA
MSSGRVVIDANLARSSMPGGGVVLLTAPSNISSVSTASTTSDAHSEEPHFNMRLIEAVQRSPCLYDANDRMYRSADYKIKVWNKLVQQLSFRGKAVLIGERKIR